MGTKIITYTLFVLIGYLGRAQEVNESKFKSDYTCDEIVSIKDTLYKRVSNTKMTSRVDSVGNIICSRPNYVITENPAFVILKDGVYVGTIGIELKEIVEKSLVKNDCDESITLISLDGYYEKRKSTRFNAPKIL